MIDPTGNGGIVSNVQSQTDDDGNVTYTADVTVNIILYSDQDVDLSTYASQVNEAVANNITNTERTVKVKNPDGSKSTVTATANITVNVSTIDNYDKATQEIAGNKTTANNYVYVGGDQNNQGEFASGNSAYLGGGVTEKNITHGVLHLLDYRPEKDAAQGSHSTNPNDVMYGRTTDQNRNAAASAGDWGGINNYQQLDSRGAPRAKSAAFGGYMNNKVFNKGTNFNALDKIIPNSTPRR